MRSLAIALGIIVLLYCVLLAAAWAGQERMVWQPPALAGRPDTGLHPIAYAADDGQRLHAWLVGDPRTARGLLIAFHGNAEVAEWSAPWAVEVQRRTGWAVLLPEYRGYGGLTGTSDYAASRRDARAAFAVARDSLHASRLAYYGHSLGSAVATELASDHPPAALLLSAPFTSARDMARRMLSLPIHLLWPVIGRVAFDTRTRVATLDVPVSVVQGDRDMVVPSAMGPAVHAAARVKGALLIVPGAGHNDIERVGGETYWRWLVDALAVAGK